jgi:hypothetical protein
VIIGRDDGLGIIFVRFDGKDAVGCISSRNICSFDFVVFVRGEVYLIIGR